MYVVVYKQYKLCGSSITNVITQARGISVNNKGIMTTMI